MSRQGLLRALGFAADGVQRAWRSQSNFRVEVVLGAAALLLCWWSGAPIAPVLAMTGLVLGLELMNSALEAVVDLVQPDHHELAKAAKDLAAAAVLVAVLAAVFVGLVVIGPPLLARAVGLLGGG